MTIMIFLGALLICMALGIPIAFSLMTSAIAMMFWLDSFDVNILAQNLINGADNFPLLAIPFFMLAGEIMNVGGLSQRIVAFPMALLRHKRGGLGFVAILTAMIVGALSGSAVADTAAVAAMMIPVMRNAGYNQARSAGLIAAGGIIAPILPPSIPMVVLGVAGSISITKLFLAGIVPGLLMGLMLIIFWSFMARSSDSGQVGEKASSKEVLRTLLNSFWALLLPVIIVGGMRLGFFTPTEAAAVAAVYSLLISMLIYRELTLSQLPAVFLSAAKTTAVIMFLVASALVTSWLLTIAELPMLVSALLEPLSGHPFLLMGSIVLIVLVIGMVMDVMPIILILTPILMPIIRIAGINEVYFGVIFVLATTISLITPPVGNVLNVVSGVSKLPLDHVIRGVSPFLLSHLVILLLLLVFPGIVTVPLDWMYSR